MADFIAQEEMNRYDGYWWTSDNKYIVFVKNDESNISLYPLLNYVFSQMKIE